MRPPPRDPLTLGYKYNGGATLNFSYDSTQRITGVTGSGLQNLPATLLSSVVYGPVGMTSATLGNNLAEARTYNNRTWLSASTVGSGGSVYSLTNLTYSGDGDVTAATDSVNGNWTYGYDDFNRLISAGKTGQSFTYDYDRLGNRWHQNITAGSGPAPQFSFNNPYNRIDGYAYDAGGNLLMDGQNCYTYDAENRLSSVAPDVTGTGVCAATAMSYLYDPDGRRVARLQGGSIWRQYYYDAAGRMITEADASGNTVRAEIYAGSRHLATWAGNATYFNHADWLGTERVRSNASGAQCETIVSLPFADGQSTNGNCGDPSPNHFTGLARDTVESGLDHALARQYASSPGRWLTPDPAGEDAADSRNPQDWNAYAYVGNNPTSAVDRDGEDYYLLGGSLCETTYECDKEGYILAEGGGRYVISDQEVLSGQAQITQDARGNTQITEGGQTFGATFFDNYVYTIGVDAKAGSALAALATNFYFALDNMANDFFAPVVGFRPSYMQNIPPGTVGNAAAAGQVLAMVLPLGPGGDEVPLTEHALQRALQRGISRTEINEAVRTAKAAGDVITQMGKYGTAQQVFAGKNNVVVVVETTGQNAGKAITAWRK